MSNSQLFRIFRGNIAPLWLGMPDDEVRTVIGRADFEQQTAPGIDVWGYGRVELGLLDLRLASIVINFGASRSGREEFPDFFKELKELELPVTEKALAEQFKMNSISWREIPEDGNARVREWITSSDPLVRIGFGVKSTNRDTVDRLTIFS